MVFYIICNIIDFLVFPNQINTQNNNCIIMYYVPNLQTPQDHLLKHM